MGRCWRSTRGPRGAGVCLRWAEAAPLVHLLSQGGLGGPLADYGPPAGVGTVAPARPAPSRPALLLPWSPRDKDTKAQVRLAGHRPRAASRRRGPEASLPHPPGALPGSPSRRLAQRPSPIGNTPALRPSSSLPLRAGTGRPLITGSPGSEQHREARSIADGGGGGGGGWHLLHTGIQEARVPGWDTRPRVGRYGLWTT